MKKNINQFLLCAVVALLTLPSCLDLTEKPLTFLTPESFYTTSQQCEGALITSMNVIIGSDQSQVYGPVNFHDGITNSLGPNLTATSYNILWALHYQAIKNINEVLRSYKEEKVPLTDANKDAFYDVVGQAYFLRAMNYFILVQFYGALPWIDETTPNVIAVIPERMPVNEVYDHIVSDLNNAFNMMYDYNTSRKARPCKWSAKALLSKVYLTMASPHPINKPEYYAQARDAAKAVIDCGHYKLLPIRDIWRWDNTNNEEFIFAFQTNQTDFRNPSGGRGFQMRGWPQGPGDYRGNGGAAKAVRSFVLDFPKQPRYYYYLITSWPKEIDTPDTAKWTWRYFEYTEEQWAEIAKLPDYGGIPGGRQESAGSAKKTWPSVTWQQSATAYGEVPGASKLSPFLRISDIYLIYAEAANMAEGSPSALAKQYYDAIVERANTPFWSVFDSTSIRGHQPLARDNNWSKDEFNRKVLEERKWELCFEVFPYWDVLRTHTLREVNAREEDGSLTGMTYKGESDYLLPIPPLDAERIGNNPGYNN